MHTQKAIAGPVRPVAVDAVGLSGNAMMSRGREWLARGLAPAVTC